MKKKSKKILAFDAKMWYHIMVVKGGVRDLSDAIPGFTYF